MTISSRTPEGWPNTCPICGHDAKTEPSLDSEDGACPNCGSLVWCDPLIEDTLNLTYFPDDFVIPLSVAELITESIVRENRVIAVGCEGEKIIVASPEPLDMETEAKLRFVLNCGLRFITVSETWFQQRLECAYGSEPR